LCSDVAHVMNDILDLFIYSHRYHLAYLSRAQKYVKQLEALLQKAPSPGPRSMSTNKAPVNSTKVCDAVSIGMRLAACRVERPWLIPNDLDKIHQELSAVSNVSDGKGPVRVKPSSLYQGCSLNKYTMITNKKIRRFLWELAVDKPLTPSQFKELDSWVKSQRQELCPYIKVEAQVCCLPVLLF